MTADGWPSRYIDAELRGPDPGWIETLFYHRRTLMVENAFFGFSLVVKTASTKPARPPPVVRDDTDQRVRLVVPLNGRHY